MTKINLEVREEIDKFDNTEKQHKESHKIITNWEKFGNLYHQILTCFNMVRIS